MECPKCGREASPVKQVGWGWGYSKTRWVHENGKTRCPKGETPAGHKAAPFGEGDR
jgi:hypothetical protein